MNVFDVNQLKNLYKPLENSSGEDNGQVTVIGGSKLFHGAPLLSLKVASRIVDMVFFATPDESTGKVAEQIKSSLLSFIWVPWEEVGAYIEKSDAILIGPGLMRFTSESQDPNNKIQMTNDKEGKRTRELTKNLLKKFPDKRWVIDAGSLQVIDPELLPRDCIITPNSKEFEMLFKLKTQNLKLKTTTQKLDLVQEKAKEFNCTIVLKGPETIVTSPERAVIVEGGNPGMTKGGTGDVLAGLVTALYAKNDAFLSSCAASFIEKFAADELYKKRGVFYNADDLADKIPESFAKILKS